MKMMKTRLKSVLVIDDEQDLCTVMKKNIEAGGNNRVTIANTAAAGYEAIEKDSYDMVFMDIKLPDTSGVELLKKVKARYPDLPICMMTAYPSVSTAVETLKNCAVDYITKPFKIQMVNKIIDLETKKGESPELSDLTEIGKKLKALRKEKNLSLDDLAEKTHLSKGFLSELERKKKFPRLSTLKTIAAELGVSAYLILE